MSDTRAGYRPDPRHTALGGDFMDEVEAAPFPRRELRFRNDRWADRVGLASLTDAEWLSHFGSFERLPDNLEQPLALRYHGHQFQSYNPELGDGRGFLFAQLRDNVDDRLLDLATKGSGQTPWSRGGDGRLTLKGGVREVLATEMLEALGVYTSKSFSLVETGESLSRGDEPSPTRSSVLVRLGHSHIRFGSFQRQAYLERPDNLRLLLDYAVEHYYPELSSLEGEARAASFLVRVVEESARLAASWMTAGFVHGVLNTDNLNITGESFDYGPFRFLPTLDPGFTAAYFDQSGLYAYGRQPEIVAWNLTRLAETLLPIGEKDALVAALGRYGDAFRREYASQTLARLGLGLGLGLEAKADSDGRASDLADAVAAFLHDSQIGFEQFFFDWWGGSASADRAARSPEAHAYERSDFAPLRAALDSFVPVRTDALRHDYFANERPCTLLIEEIEALWEAIAERDDWSPLCDKLAEIETMRSALSGA